MSAVILAAYWPVFHNDFIKLDDRQYILENIHVTSGLTWANVKWSLTSGYASNWHPLTWISHMVDVQMFGLNPRWHHSVNLLFHIINAILLFLLFSRMTGAVWRSAFVAALFALHPIHVESVAWAAERKDVLSTFFFLLTLIAYARYATVQGSGFRVQGSASASLSSSPSIRSRSVQDSRFWYFAALAFFALGLMSKPMLVTLPFVLLLLDFWPLNRLRIAGFPPQSKFKNQKSKIAGLLIEKLPFFALSLGSCIATYWAQNRGHAVATAEKLPFEPRLANAVLSYVKYIAKIIWPSNLAVFYPHTAGAELLGMTDPAVFGALLVLGLLTVMVIWRIREMPWLAIGWFWFLGTLVPVIGLVQVGGQAMADRYTYIPAIGLFLAATWAITESFATLAGSRRILPLAGTATAAICAVLTFKQVLYWKTTQALFEHTVAVTGPNGIALYILGVEAGEKGDLAKAQSCWEAALAADPTQADAHYSLGFLACNAGRTDEAIQHYEAALRIQPWHALSYNGLGSVYYKLGRTDEALAQYETALGLNAEFRDAHYNAALLLTSVGRLPEAVDHFQQACRLLPTDTSARAKLAELLVRLHNLEGAATVVREIVELQPKAAEPHIRLGDLLAATRKQADAQQQFEQAVHLAPTNSEAHYKLGQSLLDQGQLAQAESHFRDAIQFNPEDALATTALGRVLLLQGKPDEAEKTFRNASASCPTNAETQLALANALMLLGKTNEAANCFAKTHQLNPELSIREKTEAEKLTAAGDVNGAIGHWLIALGLDPADAAAHGKLGLLFAQSGKLAEAIPHFEEAVRLAPTADACHNLGLAQMMRGHPDLAVVQFRAALKLEPDSLENLNDLAWLLATHPDPKIRNGAEAVRLAEHACQLAGGKEARYWGTLDAAYAEIGRFSDAISAAEKTRQLASTAGDTNLAAAADTRLTLYRKQQPFRQ
ncbi:MAG TPA: tetratricopeptide repeat protein [Candidatus Dormibacteraeota bacterium]|nr:tetratricopeptide repeat protein [Candidatus Dormibacteraeota bacterium]